MGKMKKIKILASMIMLGLVFSLTSCDVFTSSSDAPTPMPETPPIVQAGVVKAEGNIVPVDYVSFGFPMTDWAWIPIR